MKLLGFTGWVLLVLCTGLYVHAKVNESAKIDNILSAIEGKKLSDTLRFVSLEGTQGSCYQGRVPLNDDQYKKLMSIRDKVLMAAQDESALKRGAIIERKIHEPGSRKWKEINTETDRILSSPLPPPTAKLTEEAKLAVLEAVKEAEIVEAEVRVKKATMEARVAELQFLVEEAKLKAELYKHRAEKERYCNEEIRLGVEAKKLELELMGQGEKIRDFQKQSERKSK